MKDAGSALMWLGLAVFLLPIALICVFAAVMLVIASPVAGIVFGLIVFIIGRALLTPKKGSPE